jgi:HAD superfamily hydrolase (TIGR01509 family)
MLQAVIFDMDGVLIDSVGYNWQAYNQILGRYGVHVGDDQLYQFVGLSTEDQVPLLNKQFGLQLDAKAFIAESTAIKARLMQAIQPKPGVVALLRQLKEASIPLAVGTSTYRDGMQDRLQTAGIYDYFDQLICAEDVQHHKPDPEVYIRAAAALKAPLESCVVIEDAPSGLQAAHAAGIRCVVVETPLVPRARVAQAELIVPSLEELTLAKLQALFTSVKHG